MHVTNVSPLIETIISWVKPFLKEKIRNRIFVHANTDTLYNYVPKDVLPEEYGGTAGKLQDMQGKKHFSGLFFFAFTYRLILFLDAWVKKLEEYTPWFNEQDNIKADESKRPGKPTNYDDLFGMEGSFKQLSID